MPTLDGRGASLLGYVRQVYLRMRTTRAELADRAPFLGLHMPLAPRQGRLAEGGDVLGRRDGATRILDISRRYFAP